MRLSRPASSVRSQAASVESEDVPMVNHPNLTTEDSDGSRTYRSGTGGARSDIWNSRPT
jgi:hypothetical protein